MHLPAAGGAYFRLLPYGLVRAAFKRCERRGVPGTFYIHPWELDADQPHLDVPWLVRVRHYCGLKRTVEPPVCLFREFQFTALPETVAGLFGAVAGGRFPPPLRLGPRGPRRSPS